MRKPHPGPEHAREPKLPAHNHPPGELHNFMNHFWNMLDFPRHSDFNDLEPKIEISENKKSVMVSAELPGVSEKNIDVQISSDGYLTISGEKKSETEENDNDSYFSEISYGMVRRTVPLPFDLDYDKADASYNDGMLKIAIPKTPLAQQKVKKISVKKK